MFLLSGNGKNGSKLDEYGRSGKYDIRITRALSTGWHTVEAATYWTADTGTFTLTVSHDTSTPTPTRTPTATTTPTPTPTSTAIKPAKPTGLTGIGGNGTVSLDWNDAANATGYDVAQWISPIWRTLPYGSYTVSKSGSSAVVGGLTNGRTYYHKVRSTNGNLVSSWTSHVTTKLPAPTPTATHTPTPTATPTPTIPMPSRPTGLTGTPGNGTISLDWNDAANATGYDVAQWVSPNWRTLPYGIYTVSKSGSSAVVGGLANGGTYHHTVRSTNARGTSQWATYITTKLPQSTPTPAPPTHTPVPPANTPTPTPTRTPTPVPPTHAPVPPTATPNPCNIESLASPSLSSPIDERGTWDSNSCKRKVSNKTYYTHYYSFTLADKWHATIDLLGLNADPEILLREGTSKNSVPLDTDAGGYPGSGDDSRIARVLPKGTYTVETTTVSPMDTGSFRLKIWFEEPMPFLGHQRDHTIRYEVSRFPPTRTVVPVGSPTPTNPEPASVFATAIPFAASEWNKAVAVTPWPNVLFCTGDAASSCASRNTDGKKVPIKAVMGTKNSNAADRNLDHDCGWSRACVKFSRYIPGITDRVHLMNMKGIVIEEPPWGYNSRTNRHTEYVWTNDPTLHGTLSRSGLPFSYLPAIVMHEFGHTAGLADLYGESPSGIPYGNKYDGYLMQNPHTQITGSPIPTILPQKDIDYLGQGYRNEDGSEPH